MLTELSIHRNIDNNYLVLKGSKFMISIRNGKFETNVEILNIWVNNISKLS